MSRVAFMLGCLLFSTGAHAAVLTAKSTAALTGTPDGVALGDVDGDGRMEIAVVLRGGSYGLATTTPGTGTLVLLRHDLSLIWSAQTGEELVGFPTMADFDGDGFAEVAYCEVAEAGYCHVLDGDNTPLFSAGPFYFPAMSNGGPVAADINNDGIKDLIVTSWGGEVSAFRGPSGTLAWEYDAYTPYEEALFGHAAVGDLDNDGKLEIVFGGANSGTVFVLNAENGTEQTVIADLYTPYGNYFWSSGPALANLDADNDLEIVVALDGWPGDAAVFAFDPDGAQLWRRPLVGMDLMYTSPAVADTSGDGRPEIFIQTFDGLLLRLDGATGVIGAQKDLGEDSWTSPAFIEADGDTALEIVTASLSKVFVLNHNLSEIDRYNSSGGMFPPPVVADVDVDGKMEIVTGAWSPARMLLLGTNHARGPAWTTFAGSSAHLGAVVAGDPAASLGSNAALGMVSVMQKVITAIGQTSGTPRTNLTSARDDLDLAYRAHQRGEPHNAVDRLRQALIHLQAVTGYSTTQLQKEVTYLGVLIFDHYIGRSAALHNQVSAITTAKTVLTTAKNQYAAGNYLTATQTADNGAAALRAYLDEPGHTLGNYCPQGIGEIYLAWQCLLEDVRSSVQTLLVQHPGNAGLTQADTNLRSCVAYHPDLVFATDRVPTYCLTAETNLAGVTVSVTAVTGLRKSITRAIMSDLRLYLNDNTAWFATLDLSALNAAETYYAAGVTAYNAGNYGTALTAFRNGFTQAQPCSNDSFGTNMAGLEGGGCSP